MSELEVLRECLRESHEYLEQLERNLVTLEKDPLSPQGLATGGRCANRLRVGHDSSACGPHRADGACS
jgi:chemotaxis protein histidine kinase CheA